MTGGPTKGADAGNLLRNWSGGAPSRELAEALVPGLWSALGPRRACATLERLAGEGGARRALLLDAALETLKGMVYREERASARPLLGLLRRLLPRSPEPWLVAGIERRLARDFSGAAERYAKALALAPRSARAHLYAAENLLRSGQAREAMALLGRGLARCRRVRPRGPEELTDRYRLHAAAFDFAGAERLGERLMRLPAEPGSAERLCWVPLVKDFELFTRPPSYLEALSRALGRYEARRPGSPWPAFFRVLYLWHAGGPEVAPAQRACRLLGRLASGPRDWMLAPAAVAAQSWGDEGLAREYRRRARAAGVRDHMVWQGGALPKARNICYPISA